MAFNPNAQQRLLNQSFSPLQTFKNSLQSKVPWDSIIEFATSDRFCNKRLYPRQQTLLRLMFLETEQMTQYDLDVIEEWRNGFKRHKDVFGVQPDVWERIKYLKDRGYRRFPHIQAVLGRRASKGMIGGILGCEQLAYFYSLDDWQAHYGIDPGIDCYINVIATSQLQAQRYQFADIRRTVENCRYLRSSISTSKEYYFSIRTPADVRHIAELKTAGTVIEHEIATLRCLALAANSTAGRGGVSCSNFFDEMAFLIYGTGSTKSGDEIYEAMQPSLDQFGKDALTYCPSSPFCLSPSTLVLTEDLKWVPVGSLRLGDKLIGFDEYGEKGNGKVRDRTFQPAVVTETSVIEAPRYEITMESGKKIVATSEHMWLTKRFGGMGKGNGRGQRSQSYPQNWCWMKVKDLRPGDSIKTIGVDPWETDESRDGGYLAGFFDGEGHLSVTGRQAVLGYTQNRGQILDKVNGLLAERGYIIRDSMPDTKLGKMYLMGGFPMMMRFLGSLRPERLLPKLVGRLYGSRVYSRTGPAVDRVVSIKFKDLGPVVALGTSTNTLVAEGLLSHNTKIGKFYQLYQQGSLLMASYLDGNPELEAQIQKLLRTDVEEQEELVADPEMLVFQGHSWSLYLDHERAPELVGVKFKRAIQVYDDRMKRLERKNPDKFKVERRGQFAEVEDAYLDPDKVDEMFIDPPWREPLEPQDFGKFNVKYRIHCDPSSTNANFALAVAHLEEMPKNDDGEVWPCVIIDYMKVWKPGDYPDHTIPYIQIRSEISQLLRRFPSTTKISFDQWGSIGMIADLRQEFSPRIRVLEETFTESVNQIRCERFKSALNLGWVRCYMDNFADDGNSLLEQEMKFLSMKNGKVIKQDFGPCTTKDLADAVMVVTTDLLRDSLDRWMAKLAINGAYGTTDSAGIRSGRELERLGYLAGGNLDRRGSISRELLSRQTIEKHLSATRMNRQNDPARGRTRDQPRFDPRRMR